LPSTGAIAETLSTTLGSEKLARIALDKVNPERYALETKVEGLYLIKAGRFNKKKPEEYSSHVNTFNWEELYRRSPMLIRLLAERLAAKYQYVLIDSRTGITDISGICTMLMPEKLVVVFTPNNQSIKGALESIKRATDYRKASHDLRPLTVFPLVSRVETNEPALRERWRFGDPQKKIPGFQPEFQKLFSEIYNRSDVQLDDYFDEMQIQHIPYYAYGEEIAILVEKISDKFSLRRSYKTFANRLAHSKVPWGKIDDYQEDSGERSPSLLDRLRPAVEYLRRRYRYMATALIFALLTLVVVAGLLLLIAQRNLANAEQRYNLAVSKSQAAQLELQSTGLALDDARKKLQEAQEPARVIEDLRNQINSLTKQVGDQAKESDRQVREAQQEALSQRNMRKQKETQLQQAQNSAETCAKENQKLETENKYLKATCGKRAGN